MKQNYTGKLTEEQRETIRTKVASRLCILDCVQTWYHYREKHVSQAIARLNLEDAVCKGGFTSTQQLLNESKQDDTVVFFNDSTHPQCNTHPEYGRILQGKAFEVPGQTARQPTQYHRCNQC